MIKIAALLSFILLMNCSNETKSRYSQKQIASLHIASAKILDVKSESVEKLNLNPFLKEQSFNFGSLIKKIELTPLETTDASFISDIKKIIVTESYIYIHDDFKGGGVIVFDRDGKFIKRIPNGKGPGELTRLYDIAFDNSNKELIVYQHSLLLFFTPSGQFVQQKKLPFGFYNFTVINDKYVFKTHNKQTNEHLKGLADFRLLITNKDFKIKFAGLSSPQSDVNIEHNTYLHQNCNNLYISQKFDNTIYQFIDSISELRARYFIDYGKKELPNKYTQGTWEKFENSVKKNDYYFFLGKFIDTKDHNAFFLENWFINNQTVIFRSKKTGNMIGGTNAEYNLNEIPAIAFPVTTFDNYFISFYLPSNNDLFSSKSSIISSENKLKIKGLSVNDNPVLVFFELKDF